MLGVDARGIRMFYMGDRLACYATSGSLLPILSRASFSYCRQFATKMEDKGRKLLPSKSDYVL